MKHNKEMLKRLRKRGFVIARTKGGHLRITHPNGAFTYGPSTGSDWRGWRNLEQQIKRLEESATVTPKEQE